MSAVVKNDNDLYAANKPPKYSCPNEKELYMTNNALVGFEDQPYIEESVLTSIKQESKLRESKCDAKCVVQQNDAGQFEVKLRVNANSLPAHLDTEQDIQKYVFKQLVGIEDQGLAMKILDYAANAVPTSWSKAETMQMLLSVCQNMQPKDLVEAKLCIKETVLYTSAMKYIARAENMLGENDLWYELCMKNANKLLKLHNETIETLNRYRRQGEQRVVVQHVNVADGGQAAFMSGNFNSNTGGGDNQKKQGGTS